MYSVLDNSVLPEEFGYLANSLEPINPAPIDFEDISANMEDWLQQWNSAMVDA